MQTQKTFAQLDAEGYYLGPVIGYATPLYPGVIDPPVGAVDQPLPTVPDGQRARWLGGPAWLFEALPATPPPPPEPEPSAADVLAAIDADADAIVRATIGDRGEEYRQAEAAAQAWADGGYAGAAPQEVAVWAQASGMADEAACTDILAQSAAWRAGLQQIRAARLGAKAVVRSGQQAQGWAAWQAAAHAIRKALGLMPADPPADPPAEPEEGDGGAQQPGA